MTEKLNQWPSDCETMIVKAGISLVKFMKDNFTNVAAAGSAMLDLYYVPILPTQHPSNVDKRRCCPTDSGGVMHTSLST